MFTAIANQGLIASAATQKALAVRSAITDAQNFFFWISGQSDADLTTIGFGAADISMMRSMAADLSALCAIYHGQPPPGTYTLPYPFINSSTQVIGAQ